MSTVPPPRLGPKPHTRHVNDRPCVSVTHGQLTSRSATRWVPVWAPSATDLRLSRALDGLHQAFAGGRPRPTCARPPCARCAAAGASVVIGDLVLFTLLTLLLLLPAGEGPVLLVVVVVPVVHHLAVALDVVGCRDDLVLAYDDCARGRGSRGSMVGARVCLIGGSCVCLWGLGQRRGAAEADLRRCDRSNRG